MLYPGQILPHLVKIYHLIALLTGEVLLWDQGPCRLAGRQAGTVSDTGATVGDAFGPGVDGGQVIMSLLTHNRYPPTATSPFTLLTARHSGHFL